MEGMVGRACAYERLSTTLAGVRFVAFAMLMLTRLLDDNPWKGI